MKPVCDFCFSTTVKWVYTAETFIVEKYNYRSVGDWATCNKCAELIDKNDREGLEQRSIQFVPEMLLKIFGSFEDFVHLLHSGFWKHKTGEKLPLEEGFQAKPIDVEYTN